MSNRRRIWWIASYPKSGSTWVRMFLNAYVTGFPPDINSAWQYATGDLQPHTYQLTAAQPIDRMEDLDSVYYRPAVLMNHILTAPTRDKALKTHHAKVEMDGIPLIPPRLSKGALYIVRDPRDVAVSFADHMGVSIDEAIEKMANNQMTINKDESQLFHVLLSWSTHVDSWTVHNKDVSTSVVRYEDLLERPNHTWPLVLKAMGIDVDQAKLQRARELASFAKLKAQEAAGGFREKGKGEVFFRQGQSGGWRDVLTAEQVRAIENNHRATMTRWGYLATKNNKPSTLGRIQVVASGTVQ